MVVGMITTPVPASSIREATPEESEAWIDYWIKDIATQFQEFAPNAQAYAEALCVMGYVSKSSLALLHDDDRLDALKELQDGLGLPRGMAKRLLNEALALHPRNALVPSTSAPVTATPAIPVALRPFAPYLDKLGTSTNTSHTCSDTELNRYLDTLLCHVHGQSETLGPLLEQFCNDPGMNDNDFEALQLQIPAWHHRQLASIVTQSLPPNVSRVLTAKRRGAFRQQAQVDAFTNDSCVDNGSCSRIILMGSFCRLNCRNAWTILSSVTFKFEVFTLGASLELFAKY